MKKIGLVTYGSNLAYLANEGCVYKMLIFLLFILLLIILLVDRVL